MTSLNVDSNLSEASNSVEAIFREYPAESVFPEHLLLAIARQNALITKKILEILDIQKMQIEGTALIVLNDKINHQYKNQKLDTWHESTNFIIKDAQSIQEQLSDDNLGVEHVLCSLSRVVETAVYPHLSKLGITADLIARAILVARGTKNTSLPNIKKTVSKNIQPDSKVEHISNQTNNELGTDLTSLAEKGLIDPVIGREDEIRRILNILTRRTKNNPVLVGEAGVGKTAIAEGLASKIVSGEVPMSLRGFRLFSLDVASLVKGTGVRGAFEERLTNLIETVTSSGKNIILFIDEIHQLVGAGATGSGAMDAGNILKPYLARGLIRCVGATTHNEYSKHIEKDPALDRRFQKVNVDEPSIEESVSILRGLRDKYESYHGIKIKDSAMVQAVKLSSRYITDRQLPDKAVDIIDEAASRKRMEIDSRPSELDRISENILHLELERTSLAKDSHDLRSSRLLKLNKEIELLEEKAARVTEQWNKTCQELNALSIIKQRAENIKKLALKARRNSNFRLAAEIEYSDLIPLMDKIKALQEEKQSSSLDSVSKEDIAKIVSEWTGIPVTQVKGDESKTLLNLEEELNKFVIGQKEAVKAVAQSIKIARTNLSNPNRPIGTYLFLGPTGVGKTELAKALSRKLFHNKESLIRFDMSEFFDKYTVSRLIGASPGYIGFEDGGQLTEAVKKNSFSCVLFDEIEKAHSDIYNILLQILDEGRLTDSKGRSVDFTNTVIVLTSNVASDEIDSHYKTKKSSRVRSKNPKQKLNSGGIDLIAPEIKSRLNETFKPEFLNRIDDIVLFKPLELEQLEDIVLIKTTELSQRLKDDNKSLSFSDESIKWIAEKCLGTGYGARPIERTLRSTVQAPLSELLLEGKFSKAKRIYITVDDKNLKFSTKKPN